MTGTIKHRRIRIHIGAEGINPSAFTGEITDLNGVLAVRYDRKGVLYLKYDLLETNLTQIEETMKRLGVEPAGGIFNRTMRGWIHFTEKNEFDNLMSIPSNCCALDEHERVVREDVQEQVPKAKKNTAIRTGLQV